MIEKLCYVVGCGRESKHRGLCKTHYERFIRNEPEWDRGIESRRKYEKGQLCEVDGCSNHPKGRGLCSKHLKDKIQSEETRECVHPSCERKIYAKGYCSLHYSRWANHIDMDRPEQRQRGEGYLTPSGYVMVEVNGSTKLKHRIEMEKHIERELEPHENVHHKNGVRDDNRIENLELWVSHQPPGQRPRDLVKWAKEILEMYGNEFPDD